MNGEQYFDFDLISDVLNQPDLQENYPMDFSGYMYEEPVYEAPPEAAPVYEVSPAQRIQVWSQSQEAQAQEPLISNELVNFFGKVIDVGAKTYQQIATQTEVEKFKTTPYVSSALNALGYPTARTPQTGVDTGMKTVSSLTPVKQALSSIPQALSSMSPMILILGIGILAFVMMGKK